MNTKEVQVKILAQAVYELRVLLSRHLGSTDNDTACEAISAHLAYALHNEALAVIENRPEDFDVDKALENIKALDERYGEQFGERFQKLASDTES